MYNYARGKFVYIPHQFIPKINKATINHLLQLIWLKVNIYILIIYTGHIQPFTGK